MYNLVVHTGVESELVKDLTVLVLCLLTKSLFTLVPAVLHHITTCSVDWSDFNHVTFGGMYTNAAYLPM